MMQMLKRERNEKMDKLHGYFILSGQGGELDRFEYEAKDNDDMNQQFRVWIATLVLSEDDTIRIIEK